MTNEQLDALVAEKVMGWKQAADNLWPGRLWWVDNQGTHLFYADGNTWTPTTGIAQAWQVVERMVELGWRYTIVGDPSSTVPVRVVFNRGEPFGWGMMHADTSPLAIVLSALKAVGVEVEE